MGINNGLRACDLVRVKVGDIRYMKVGDTLTIKESKTGKDNILLVNKTVYKALQAYLDALRPDDDAYLFASRKGNGHIQSQAVSKLVKKWTKAINLKGNYGSHTLRKTWGYIQRTIHGVASRSSASDITTQALPLPCDTWAYRIKRCMVC